MKRRRRLLDYYRQFEELSPEEVSRGYREHSEAARSRALAIIPALDLANILPLTPGNIGVASAAIVFALKAHGAEIDTAIAAGIAFSAVETVTSIAFGVGSTLYLLGGQAPGFRRYALVGVSAAGCLALGAAFGATVVMPLV